MFQRRDPLTTLGTADPSGESLWSDSIAIWGILGCDWDVEPRDGSVILGMKSSSSSRLEEIDSKFELLYRCMMHFDPKDRKGVYPDQRLIPPSSVESSP